MKLWLVKIVISIKETTSRLAYFFYILPFLKKSKVLKLHYLSNLFQAAPCIHKLIKLKKIQLFGHIKNQSLLVIIDGIKMIIETTEEWFIIQEIYFQGDYNFIFPKNCVVIDIGMNIGLSSLFFAQKEEVKMLYSFEPVQPSYERALENFSLNPTLFAKIQPHNVGIGPVSRQVLFEYNKDFAGISKQTELRSPSSFFQLIPVKIKAVNKVITPIFHKHKKESVILKIDCEGAEYGIIEALIAEGLIQKIQALVLEWHGQQNVYNLVESLKKQNFLVVFKFSQPQCGLIYATNTKNQRNG